MNRSYLYVDSSFSELPGTLVLPGLRVNLFFAAFIPAGRRSGGLELAPLLELDGGAGALQLCFRLVRLLLVGLLENGLGGRVDEVLGLFQAEAR